MTYLLAAALVVLKAAAVLLAVVLGLVILLVSLPLRARLSLTLATRGLLEGVLDDDARPLFRVAGVAKDEPGPQEDRLVVPVDVGYRLSLISLGGIAQFDTAGGRGLHVRVLGMSFRAREGRKEKPLQPLSRPLARPRKGQRIRTRRARVSLAELRAYLAPGVREKTLAFLKALLKALHFEGDVDVETGFPDPGFTGMAYAAYSALGGPGAFGGVRFRPNFEEEMIDARGRVQLSLVPARIGWIAGRYLLAREIRPLWRARRRGPDPRNSRSLVKPVLQDSDG